MRHLLFALCVLVLTFKTYRFLYVPPGLTFKIVHDPRCALSVIYISQNRQRLLLYTSLTVWFL